MSDRIDTKVIQVTNVAPHASRDQMKTLFGFVGRVREIKLYPPESSEIEVSARVCYIEFDDNTAVGIALHLTNVVFIDRAIIVVPVMDGKIPDENTALQLTPQAVAGMLPGAPTWPSNVVSRKVGQGSKQIINTYDPRLVALGLPQYPPLPASVDPSKIQEIRRTVYVGNLDTAVLPEQLLSFFSQVGEVKYIRMAGGEHAHVRYAYVEFSDQRAVATALTYNGVMFQGRPIQVSHSIAAIVKPQSKSAKDSQREVEEAMKKVKEAHSLIAAAADSRRSRSSSRTRSKRRSRSRSRRRSHSRTRRRSHSKSRRSRSRDRRRSKDRGGSSRRKRSGSRSRKRSSRSRSRSRRNRSGSRSKHNRSSRRSRSRDKRRSRSKSRTKRSKSKERKRSRTPPKAFISKSRKSRSPSRSRKKSASPSKEKRRKSTSASPSPPKLTKERSVSPQTTSNTDIPIPQLKRSSLSRSPSPNTTRSSPKRRSKSPKKSKKSKRSSRSRSRSGSRHRSKKDKKKDRSRSRDRSKKKRSDKERDREEKSSKDSKVVRDYDEEEKGYSSNGEGGRGLADIPPPPIQPISQYPVDEDNKQEVDMEMSDGD